MKKIAWVTDSTAFLDEELRSHPDVYQIPMTIVMDEKEYLDGIDLSAHDLFEKLKTLSSPPKTSQPPVGVFKEQYEKLEKDYDAVMSLHVSAKLSGTVDSSRQAGHLVDIPVYTVDSKTLSFMLTALLKKGMSLAAKGTDPEEIVDKLNILTNTIETFVQIGSLEQLHRSGRMSGVQFLLGSVLNIKPVITLKNGELSIKEKVRSDRKAKERIFDYLRKSHEQFKIKQVFLLYGLHHHAADDWKQELEQLFPDISFDSYPLGAVIGVHAGENTLGIGWFAGDDTE
ncbi:DegV family protein [Mesobacillus harenae]|uniref:DegV family protein n=1 Tax=Mesobacillus harenae TaxID=2213203 RepID=UPI001580EF8F|nr:DegV family protein [Mesobacillus harenae]